MTSGSLNILAVVGTLSPKSGLSCVVHHIVSRASVGGGQVDVLDLENEPLAIFNPETARTLPGYAALQERIDRADVIVFATPDYHGSVSGAIKNFLDHFWREFAGKLFVIVVASHDKGLTVADQLRTVARQCYAWSLPYAATFAPGEVKDGAIATAALRERLEMMVRDMRVYGELLARQRRADLAGSDPGFMARHRQ